LDDPGQLGRFKSPTVRNVDWRLLPSFVSKYARLITRAYFGGFTRRGSLSMLAAPDGGPMFI
jgi:hypothetical protein